MRKRIISIYGTKLISMVLQLKQARRKHISNLSERKVIAYYTYEGMLLHDIWDLVRISLPCNICYRMLTWYIKAYGYLAFKQVNFNRVEDKLG